jgi:hypothetical protein
MLKRTLGWEEGPMLHIVASVSSGVIAQTVGTPARSSYTLSTSHMMD